MSWLDDIFGGSSTPAQPAQGQGPTMLPPAANPDPRVTPSYEDFIKGLTAANNAKGWFGNIGQHGILGAIGQTDRDNASLPVTAPDAYLKLLQAQQGTQATGLDLAQTQEFMRRAGFNPAGAGAPQSNVAPVGAPDMPGPPQASQAPAAPPQPALPPGLPPAAPAPFAPPSAAPVSAGPPPVPGAAPPVAGSPVDAMRARYANMASLMAGLPKFAPVALEYTKLGQTGAVPGTMVNPANGQLVDAGGGTPTGNLQQFLAHGAGLKSGAEAQAQVGPHNAETAFKGQTEQTTNRLKLDQEAGNAPVSGFDRTTGQPITTTKLAVGQGKVPNFIEGANPFFAGQQEELKGLRESAQTADSGLQVAQNVFNAANGLYTGAGADSLQDVRKIAQAASTLTGVPIPDAINNDTSKFEQMKFAAQQLVAKASHDMSPRIAQSIVAQINAVKPGDKTSIAGLRDIIANEIVPELARQKAAYGTATQYYEKNPLKRDASRAIMDQLPRSQFQVKTDPGKVNPGDFFIHPQTGELLQRPRE